MSRHAFPMFRRVAPITAVPFVFRLSSQDAAGEIIIIIMIIMIIMITIIMI